jgi:hypothetical protein
MLVYELQHPFLLALLVFGGEIISVAALPLGSSPVPKSPDLPRAAPLSIGREIVDGFTKNQAPRDARDFLSRTLTPGSESRGDPIHTHATWSLRKRNGGTNSGDLSPEIQKQLKAYMDVICFTLSPPSCRLPEHHRKIELKSTK